MCGLHDKFLQAVGTDYTRRAVSRACIGICVVQSEPPRALQCPPPVSSTWAGAGQTRACCKTLSCDISLLSQIAIDNLRSFPCRKAQAREARRGIEGHPTQMQHDAAHMPHCAYRYYTECTKYTLHQPTYQILRLQDARRRAHLHPFSTTAACKRRTHGLSGCLCCLAVRTKGGGQYMPLGLKTGVT